MRARARSAWEAKKEGWLGRDAFRPILKMTKPRHRSRGLSEINKW